MDRNTIVLAALAPAGDGQYTPVQVQKLLFLLDKNIGRELGGPFFSFEPYDYGPFDKEVYQVLDQLRLGGLVEIMDVPGRNWKQYKLTEAGKEAAAKELSNLEHRARSYIESVSSFVRSLSFAQLVSAIYKEYPEMKVNSVFNQQ